MAKTTHAKLKKVALSRIGVRKEYDSLTEEFNLLEEMLNARLRAGKTQTDVARVMKTTTSVVGRLETGGGAHRHSPTVESLRRYARAVNCSLEVKFVHTKSRPKSVIKRAHKKEKMLAYK